MVGRWWGLGVLPQKISGLNGVKSCSSRQDKHRSAPPQNPARGLKFNVCEDFEKGKLM